MKYLFSHNLFFILLTATFLAAGCSDNSGGDSNRYSNARLLNVADSVLLTNEETFTVKIFYATGFPNMTNTVFTVVPSDNKICKMTSHNCSMAGDSCIAYIQLQSGENFGSSSVKIKFHNILNTTEGGEVNLNVVHKEKVLGGYLDNIDGVTFPMLFVEGGTAALGLSPTDSMRLVHTIPYNDSIVFRDSLSPELIHTRYPSKTVKLEDFYISKTEVTCAQYKAVMGSLPNGQEDGDRAVEASFYQSWDFAKELSKRTGRHYRIASRYEWEYAAIGGQKSKGYTFPGSNNLLEVAWTLSQNQSHISNAYVVGQKKPNELGIYDMAGNEAEWVNDSVAVDYIVDGKVAGTFIDPYSKGGNCWVVYNRTWQFFPWHCNRRYNKEAHIGIRLVISRKDYKLKPVE